MKIVHIADVHWRGLSRHKEYRESFSDFFKKAKKFDVTGVFGFGSDEMTKEEFENYLKSKIFTIHD